MRRHKSFACWQIYFNTGFGQAATIALKHRIRYMSAWRRIGRLLKMGIAE